MKYWVHLERDSTCLDFGMGGEREEGGGMVTGRREEASKF